jgi:hypothetical protein
MPFAEKMFMPIKFLLPLLLSGVAAPSVAFAQPQEQQDPVGRDIVVQGIRDLDRQVGDFVIALTDVPMSGQISRFDWAVCPNVVGLSDRQNALAADRMRQVAEAAGIRVGKAGCKGNILVMVADDVPAVMKWLRSKHFDLFEGVPSRRIREMSRGGSAVAWHVEGLLDADGVEVPRDRDTGLHVIERTDTPSRISTVSRPHFAAAVVVFDGRALEGLTVVQLADYAAMRAFARTDPSRLRDSSAPSILSVVDAPMGSAVPITLTQWDLAYLKALYSATENRRAGQQRGEMSRQMGRELKRHGEED